MSLDALGQFPAYRLRRLRQTPVLRQMVRETVRGTVDLQDLDGADAAEIVRRVAHPGGPSEAGVTHLRSALPAMYEAMLKHMHKW